MLSNHRSRGASITSAAVPATLASTVPPTAASQAAHAVARRQRWTLGVVCAATALLLFNVTGPLVALPSIAVDLRLSFTSQQWVLSSYALVLASLLLAGGALGDRLGQAPVPHGPRRVRRRLRCRRARGLGGGVDRGARRAGHRCGSDTSRRAGARSPPVR